jgi:hypothetical protein
MSRGNAALVRLIGLGVHPISMQMHAGASTAQQSFAKKTFFLGNFGAMRLIVLRC